MSLSYRNVHIAPEDRHRWQECLKTIREIVDCQPTARLMAYVQVFWFDDSSFALVPVGPEDMTPSEALALVRAASFSIDTISELGTWRKADLAR